MVEMADNSKLDSANSRRNNTDGIEENSVAQKISVLDQLNGFQYTTEKKSDNFVIDMEAISNGNKDNSVKSNSRITLQRSLSRKGSSRGGCGGAGAGSGGDTTVPAASSSPRGSSMPEKAAASSPLVVADPQVHHHQITITTAASNLIDGRFPLRRNSFKRPPFSLAIDPKRVLFFFATLSSMGTILLIYFTLSMSKYQD